MAILIYHLDPSYFAAPSFPESIEDAERHITDIITIGRLKREAIGLSVCSAPDLLEQLVLINAFPLRAAIEEMLQLYGLVGVFSVVDLVRLYNRLLDSVEPVDEICPPLSGLVSACTLLPDIFQGMFPADLALFSRLAAGQAAIAKEYCDGIDAVFGTSVVKKAEQIWAGVTVVPLGSDFIVPASGAFSVEGRIDVVRSPSFFGMNVDSHSLWAQASNTQEVHLALSLKIQQILCSMGEMRCFTQIPKFTIGSGFLQSLIDNQGIGQGAYASVVFETCARLAMGSPKSHVRDLLQDGSVIKRGCDGALAKRTHITEKGEALRLLFWDSDDGYELANIGVKHELRIEHGDLAARVG